ncbi:LamB/YcsF family protein [Herbidospora yilanensis]|uniref:LamB/YcsF family protein n=1 Tax=Herbidospora yilanensis TaxID=354426 RepID=UPI0007862D4B|nr:5-oxoprolinase subunit PxpA [Herbidospora yilanensis]
MRIDLNADLGEGFGAWKLGDDAALLEIVTSANVACGFHAGDPLTIRRVCEAAVARGVAIGAQVSYRDLAGFGRREMDVPAEELRAEVLYQLAAVDGIARAVGGRVAYVKPHGALYNRIVWDEVQARAVADAVADYGTLPVLTVPGSALQELGTPTVTEYFADRAYTPEGTLVSRREPGSVLHDPVEVAARAIRMAREGVVTAVDGSQVRVTARSICVHGDTPGAVRLARAVHDALVGVGVAVEAFT